MTLKITRKNGSSRWIPVALAKFTDDGVLYAEGGSVYRNFIAFSEIVEAEIGA